MKTVVIFMLIILIGVIGAKWYRQKEERVHLVEAQRVEMWKKEGQQAYRANEPIENNPYLYTGMCRKCSPSSGDGKGLDALMWEEGWINAASEEVKR